MKALIRWTLEFDYPIRNDNDLEQNKFYIEEHLCQENLLDFLVNESEEGKCKLCSIGKVELLEIKT